MRLLTILLGTLTVLAPLTANAGVIEGVDQETYNRNTQILMMNRSTEYNKSEDFYYDYKNSGDYECYHDESMYVEPLDGNDDNGDVIINGAF